MTTGINLLLNPSLVRECVEEIKNKVSKQVSIKTRIGVDSQTSDNVLDYFLIELNKEYINKYIIHARIAIRGKLNTKDNLSVPSLNYERVFRLKEKFKGNKIIINGGFKNTDYNKEVFKNIDGIMIGREAYKNPWMFNKNINSNDIDKKKKNNLSLFKFFEK